jgi:hypothetical protein
VPAKVVPISAITHGLVLVRCVHLRDTAL